MPSASSVKGLMRNSGRRFGKLSDLAEQQIPTHHVNLSGGSGTGSSTSAPNASPGTAKPGETPGLHPRADATPTPTTGEPSPVVSRPHGSSAGHVQFAVDGDGAAHAHDGTTIASPATVLTSHTPSSEAFATAFAAAAAAGDSAASGRPTPPGDVISHGPAGSTSGASRPRPKGHHGSAAGGSRSAHSTQGRSHHGGDGAAFAGMSPQHHHNGNGKVRLHPVASLDDTTRANLKLHLYRESDRADWSFVVEKLVRDRAKARKEKEQLKLGCCHPNIVKYLFHKPHEKTGGESVFLEFMNLGSLRGLMDRWDSAGTSDASYSEHLASSFAAIGVANGSVSSATTSEAMGSPAASWRELGSTSSAFTPQQTTVHTAGADDDASAATASPHELATTPQQPPPQPETPMTPGCRRAPAPWERVLLARCIGKQLFAGLTYYHVVHERFHRDIKPGNLLIAEGGRVKLCDFDSHKDACESGATMDGTNCYIPPELARGVTVSASGKHDVWAAGIVLYELVLGQHPFREISTMRLVRTYEKIVAALPLDDIPNADLRDLIRGCLTCAEPERLTIDRALTHRFFTRPLVELAADTVPEGAPAALTSSLTECCCTSKASPDAKAEREMRACGIDVDEDNPLLELSTWRAVREKVPTDHAVPGSPSASAEEKAKHWRRGVDNVMKRIVHTRQRCEHKLLAALLKRLGHNATHAIDDYMYLVQPSQQPYHQSFTPGCLSHHHHASSAGHSPKGPASSSSSPSPSRAAAVRGNRPGERLPHHSVRQVQTTAS